MRSAASTAPARAPAAGTRGTLALGAAFTVFAGTLGETALTVFAGVLDETAFVVLALGFGFSVVFDALTPSSSPGS